MKLQIENWADENLTGNAKELFKEAVICFKAGAYRSSFSGHIDAIILWKKMNWKKF